MDEKQFLLRPSTRFSVVDDEGDKHIINMKGDNCGLSAHILKDDLLDFMMKGDVISIDVSLILARKDGEPGDLNADEEHALDILVSPNIQELPRLLGNWRDMSATRVYAIMIQGGNSGSSKPIGLVSWTGPNDRADPSWWIHSDYRGNYFGSSAVDALAKEMGRHGVIGINPNIKVQTPKGRYDNQSNSLIQKLQSHF